MLSIAKHLRAGAGNKLRIMLDALWIVLLGMGIIFAVMAVLFLAIVLANRLPKPDKKAKSQ
jgi:Na+-transporting methylmalonyl-CoA/oxaloacetate decarboxylase gamma subunit